MGEWKEYKLGDIADITSSKRVFYSEYVAEGVPFYRSKEVIDKFNKRNVQTELFISEERFKAIKEKFGAPEKDEILLTSVGTLGIPYLINEKDRFYFKDGNLTWFRKLDKDTVNAKYLFLWLQSKIGQQKLNEVTIGSTQPALTIAGLKEIEIELPDLPEQKSIASVLSSLDDKIDLLHRQNKTLETLAETVFRHWFVEEAEGLETKTLDELIVFDPREKVSNTVEYTFFDMKCLSDSSIIISEGIKRTVNSGSSFRNGDTLLAKITPCLENGKTGFVMNLEEGELARGSTEFILMRSKEGVSPYFVYCLARYSDFRNTAIFSMTGTSGRQRVQTAVLKDYQIKFSKKAMERFHSFCHPHFLKIRQNQIQIRTLTHMRDTLLPKLMSGKVRVRA